jgi:hypothetical protein
MKKTTMAISLLAVTLVITNGWWAYRLLEAGVSYTHQGVSLEQSRESLSRALAIIRVLGAGDASRRQVIKAAQQASPSVTPFEKEGYVWMGELGLRFDASGRLVDAIIGN